MVEAARRHRSRLVLCLLIVYLVWGSSYLATRIGVQHLPPLLFSGVRFIIAGVLLGALMWRRGVLTALRADLQPLLWMSVLGIAVCNGLNTWAMQWVPSNEGSLLNGSSAFFIALLGTLGPRSHPLRGLALAGMVIGIGGTALLLWPAAGISTALLPQGAILLACLLWSAATIYLRNTATQLDVVSFVAAQMLLGGVAMVCAGLTFGERLHIDADPRGWLSMGYLILMNSCLAYPAYAWLTRHATPSQVGSYGYVNPAVATLLGWMLLDERLVGPQILGTVAILGGVLLVNWPTRGAPGGAAGAAT